MHLQRRLKVSCHGDDFLCSGKPKEIAWIEGFLRANFTVKFATKVGPGHEKLAHFLNRAVIFVPERGFLVQPNKKHVEDCEEDLGLLEAKPVAAPAVRNTARKSGAEAASEAFVAASSTSTRRQAPFLAAASTRTDTTRPRGFI